MGNLVSFGNAKLPSVQTLAQGLRKMDTGVSADGVVLLKMDKTGHWVFGADATEVEDESLWAVNPFSFSHGYIAWGKGEVLAEKMASVQEPLPEVDAPPAGAERGWETQAAMMLQCVNGEDEGLAVRYAVSSLGGKRALQTLAATLADQIEKDPSRPVPVIRLKKDHYSHKQYGRVFTPVFEVADWVGLDGGDKEAAVEKVAAAPEPVVEDAPRRRRRV